MNEASQRIAEHRGDLDAAKRSGYFVGEGASVLGERPPSFAQCQLDVQIAWTDFEDALAAHEPRAASDALARWSDAMVQLRAIGETR